MNPGYSRMLRNLAVGRVRDGESAAKVAADLEIHKSTLYGWLQTERRKTEREAEASATAMLQEREREIDELHSQIRELKALAREMYVDLSKYGCSYGKRMEELGLLKEDK